MCGGTACHLFFEGHDYIVEPFRYKELEAASNYSTATVARTYSEEGEMRHKWLLVLACGWILLQPPPKLPLWTRLQIWLGLETAPTPTFSRSSFDADLGAQLSKWEYVASFDTAKECGADKAAAYNIIARSKVEVSPREFQYLSSSRCVPASLELR